MTPHRSRLLDTLARIEATTLPPRTSSSAKTASAAPSEPCDGDLLRALARAVRGACEAPVTDDDLRAVLKVAEAHTPLAPLAVDGSRPSDQLRKLAYALRTTARAAESARLEKAAHMLRATQALTLLGDRVRAL